MRKVGYDPLTRTIYEFHGCLMGGAIGGKQFALGLICDVLGPDWESYVGTSLQFHWRLYGLHVLWADFTWIVLELIWELNRSV